MRPLKHLISGILFSFVILVLFPNIGLVGISLIIASTFFIDVDHYLYYVYKKRDWSLRKAYRWCITNEKKFKLLSQKKREKTYVCFCFLHGIEVLLILFLGIFVSIYFLYIFVGFALHILLDIVDKTTILKRIDKFSLIYDYLKFKKFRQIK